MDHPGATSTKTSTVFPKKEVPNDSPETSVSQPTNVSSHVNSSQSHPKKKGGFVITSVKDNVGDESADDLDESHASYSDVSYSRTTDIDHDQESSASEDTLNMTLQDGFQHSNIATQNQNIHLSQMGTPLNTPTDQTARLPNIQTASQITKIPSTIKQSEKKPLKPGSSLEFSQELPSDITSDATVSAVQTGGTMTLSTGKDISSTEPLSGTILPQTSFSHSQQLPHSKLPAGVKSTVVSASVTSMSMTSTTSTMSSTTTKTVSASSIAPTKGGASRVYKVVKRESLQPTRRDRGRWTCFDYGDVLIPNLGFVAQSASDSRLTFHDAMHHHSTNQLPLSLSTTSVPSSSSAYSLLQHSDSSSSVHREAYQSGLPMGANLSNVQHSASTSSINHDLDMRKLSKNSKSLIDSSDEATKRILLSADERLSGENESDQELLRNVIRNSGDLTTNTEDESASSSNVNIDNKIEAAMDLVKKHLMLAVRDEVDELKEKIVDLQEEITKIKSENETLKGILTPDQIAMLQPVISRSMGKNVPLQKAANPQTQQMYQQQPQQSNIPNQAQLDNVTSSQPQPSLNHLGGMSVHQPLTQKPSLPLSSMAYSMQGQPLQPQRLPSIPVQNLNKSINQPGTKPVTPQMNIPQTATTMTSAQQQQLLQKQIHAQQPLPQQGQVGRQVPYPQNSTVYHSVPPQKQQPQLTPQQFQALRQQVYQQAPSQQAAVQPGYSTPQLVMQQTAMPPLAQQSQVPAAQFQQNHPGFQQQANQAAALAQSSQLPQSQNVYMHNSQTNPPRSNVQTSQSATALPRQHPHQGTPSVTSPTTTLPPMHQHQVPTTLHPQLQPVPMPTPSAAPHINGSNTVEQRHPLS